MNTSAIKVLFVYRSRGSDNKPAPFIESQLQSLKELGIETARLPVHGNGLLSYWKAAIQLRKFLRDNDYDLLHAHYSLSAMTALLARSGKPIVLSLMGSDVLGEFIEKDKISLRSRVVKNLTKIIRPLVDAVIVKSENLLTGSPKGQATYVIPNGVNLKVFKPMDKLSARRKLGLNESKKYVLFLANPQHQWKNFPLAKEAFRKLNDPGIELITPYPVTQEQVVLYLNAADVFISTSFMEGSSNVIKEAMACNTPVVATDVGDARKVIGTVEGCYLIGFEPDDAADKIKSAIDFSLKAGKTKGRERIIESGLDSESVAKRIKEVYRNTITSVSSKPQVSNS